MKQQALLLGVCFVSWSQPAAIKDYSQHAASLHPPDVDGDGHGQRLSKTTTVSCSRRPTYMGSAKYTRDDCFPTISSFADFERYETESVITETAAGCLKNHSRLVPSTALDS